MAPVPPYTAIRCHHSLFPITNVDANCTVNTTVPQKEKSRTYPAAMCKKMKRNWSHTHLLLCIRRLHLRFPGTYNVMLLTCHLSVLKRLSAGQREEACLSNCWKNIVQFAMVSDEERRTPCLTQLGTSQISRDGWVVRGAYNRHA